MSTAISPTSASGVISQKEKWLHYIGRNPCYILKQIYQSTKRFTQINIYF